jgi:hypothetical protein
MPPTCVVAERQVVSMFSVHALHGCFEWWLLEFALLYSIVVSTAGLLWLGSTWNVD